MESRAEFINSEMQKTEAIRKKKLLSMPRHQFFLAAKFEESDSSKYKSVAVQIDLDPAKDKDILCRFIGVDYTAHNGWGLRGFFITFISEEQISELSRCLHLNDIYSAINTIKGGHFQFEHEKKECIEILTDLWRVTNRSYDSWLIHEVECLADNITRYGYERIWTLDGPDATPQLLMSGTFTFEGIKKAIKDKADRKIFEKGYAEGRNSALQELSLLKAKPSNKEPDASKIDNASVLSASP